MRYLIDVYNTELGEHVYYITTQEGIGEITSQLTNNQELSSISPLNGAVYSVGAGIENIKTI